MREKLLLLSVSLGIFLLFAFFSYLVHKDLFVRVDFDATVRLQDQIPKAFDRVFFYHGARTEKLQEKAQTVVVDTIFSTFSELGKFEPMLILLIILLLLRRRIWGIVAFACFGFFHIVEIYGKWFVEHLPPPQFLLRTKHLIDFPQFHVRAENSYPSGHSGRALFITVLLAFFTWKSKKIGRKQKVIIMSILVLYDVIMFSSRIYLGEHWFTDVVGGALLGLAFALVAIAFL